MGTRCHHGMHRHTHELFLRNIRAEGLVLFCLRIHHMKSCVDGIQGCVEIRQFLLPHRLVCYIIVEVVIILQQILMVLIHADITVQRKNKSSDGRNIVYRRDWSCLIQLVQISLPFRCADRNSQLRLIVVTAEQCGTSHTGFFATSSMLTASIFFSTKSRNAVSMIRWLRPCSLSICFSDFPIFLFLFHTFLLFILW